MNLKYERFGFSTGMGASDLLSLISDPMIVRVKGVTVLLSRC